MASMKAALVHRWDDTPVVEDVPMPTPGSGETLVRVEAALVNHLDLTVLSGAFDPDLPRPYVPGVEGSGTVVSSDTLPVGTRVLVHGAGIGIDRAGTWAQFVSVPSAAAYAVPPTLSFEIAAAFIEPTASAWTALYDVANLGADETVIVTGATGAVGRAAIAIALAAGARVIGLVRKDADRHWVTAPAEAMSEQDIARLDELAREQPGTLLVDSVGGPELATRCSWLRPGSRAVVIGYVGGVTTEWNLVDFIGRDVSLLPLNMIRRQAVIAQHFSEFVALVEQGVVPIDVRTFTLDQVGDAVQAVRAGGARARMVLRPWTKPDQS
ncbi:zinc-binding alcohol dehydrogenase family protein [Streptomyces sp. ISID311]|uniref:quinone oxidoreductase family protein n=1 Tax=Streptomyces sp. ISID311 TaxID=2601673 RepID=UPI00164A7F9A|nr:zinc-binding alcohol dehydrogenase family protein [Streptomyces sp. ISID311]